ncbi:MAG: sigma-54-dependent Fis family transcriptional regulator [Deltaproteobacteria bacterium]|nr:sigma-54-dependent Fis family transcriptional regulator [Deltaproteobacteria bacterium]
MGRPTPEKSYCQAGWVGQHRKSLIVNDVKDDPRHKQDIEQVTGFVTHSIMAAPVEYQGEILRTLEVLNPKDKSQFDNTDLVLVEALASQVAIAIRYCDSYSKLNEENVELKKAIHLENTIIGQSKAIREVIQLAEKVAPFEVTVLLTGESGTGKELVARLIHESSPRKEKPFIAVNCSALPENLIESELFGHEKGAFTGAITNRKGKFEMASGGTLFLDEIGDMGFSVQAKILRVLETGIIERVGSNQLIRTNVRVIAATNKNLRLLLDEEKFREDLYYRLNEIHIEIPPLKERKSDIPLLANHFLNLFSSLFQKNIKGLSEEVLDLFMNHEWPGNIREMKNVIKASVILSDDPTILLGSLPDEIRRTKSQKVFLSKEIGSLEGLEKQHITKLLMENDWNKTKTAQILNISRPTLNAKIKQYGIIIEK